MPSGLDPEQVQMREAVRQLARERIAPRAAEIDRKAEYPADVELLLREQGVLALPIPERYGGVDGRAVSVCLAIEEIAKVCATSALILTVQALGAHPILLAGTEEQKRRLLPPLAAGRLVAYALTEPEAGSDAASLRTVARREGGDYLLSGEKIFITHGSIAQTLIVFARTGEAGSGGISAFVLERERSPWAVLRTESKMGIRGSPTAHLSFDRVRVPPENRLGAEGDGFKIALQVLDRSRPGVAAQALGIAEGALEFALRYAEQRQQFGRPIAQFQGLQWMLADMATQVEAARGLVYTAARMVEEGGAELTAMAAMAKLFASDTAMKVTTDAVQILGGYGYTSDLPVERMMRDAKITQIYEGTNQVQRLVIGRSLLSR